MNGWGRDLLFGALVVSLLVHVGAMIWVRPRVMSRAAQVVRTVATRAMRVTAASEAPPPVELAQLLDEDAVREAPQAEWSAAILPAAELALPASGAASPMPEAAAVERLEALTPSVEPPAFELPSAAPATAADLPRLPADMPKPVAAAEEMPVFPRFANVAPVAPAPEGPVFAAELKVAEVREQMVRPRAPELDEPAIPTAVMAEVDERVVEEEKAAVRRLLDDDDALSMDAAVAWRLSTADGADGYTYFRLVFSSKVRLPAVEKDVVVLVDASGSIGDDRLKSCQQAARKILRTAMNSGDRFNLVAFRNRFTYAFKNWQPCEAASFKAADRFLASLAAHGRTDIFSTIASVLTLPRDPRRPLIALVVTDGDANQGVSETSEILRRFARLNDGLISVFMYGVKGSANRPLIDLLTRTNRGESFVFDGRRWKAGEGMEALSERFRDPLITDLRLVFTADLEVETRPTLLKNLYRGNTVEVLGRVRGAPKTLSFSLRGLAGAHAYDGFYRLPLAEGRRDPALPAEWNK